LDFSVEPALLAGCGILGLYIFHDLIHVSPRVKSLKLQDLSPELEAVSASVRGANSKCAGKFLR
jgi:hypothetical protein